MGKDDYKSIFLIVGLIILLVIIVVVFRKTDDVDPSTRILVPDAGEIEIRGELTCLPHRDTTGHQTLECAFGLKDDQGRYYGLRDSDPNFQNISTTPMNVPVRIEGTFFPAEDTKYQSIGTIEVERLERIDTSKDISDSTDDTPDTFDDSDGRIGSDNDTQPVACPAIAMQCPNGTYVGPSGPRCEFVCPQ